jgi:hypothetical protein
LGDVLGLHKHQGRRKTTEADDDQAAGLLKLLGAKGKRSKRATA